jgi:4-carboxymuconolactone decarboxylase
MACQAHKKLNEILGPKGEEAIRSLQETSPDFAKYLLNFVYGEIYSRPSNLTNNLREIAAVSCLIGSGSPEGPLQHHIRGMLRTGWVKDDVIELIIFLSVFIGFPAATRALSIAKKTFDDEVLAES